MSALTEEREAAASALTTALADFGVSVYPTWPDTLVSPPAVIVIPGSPYLDTRGGDGSAFGEVTVNLRVVVVAQTSATSVQTSALDDLLIRTAEALHGAGFQINEVEQPGDMSVGTKSYLATFIRISTTIRLSS